MKIFRVQLLACLLLITSCGKENKKQDENGKEKVEKKASKENQYKEKILELIDNEDITYTGDTGFKVIPLIETILLVKQESEITDNEMDDVIFMNVNYYNNPQKQLSFNMIDVLGKEYLVNGVKFYVAELSYPHSEDISVVQVGQYNLQEKKSPWKLSIPKRKFQEK